MLGDGGKQESRFAHSRLWDFISGLPCALFCLFAIYGFAIQIGKQISQPVSITLVVQTLSKLASILFFSMQAFLICVRRLPLRKLAGPMPRLIALVAAYFSFALILLPPALPSASLAITSSALLLTGTFGSIITLAYLGRSFSILPQARGIVTSGPYCHMRHPLYLCEQISLLGVSLQFRQPWGLFIALVGSVLQFPRIRNEESVLLEAFPEYEAYRKSTAMLVPGIK